MSNNINSFTQTVNNLTRNVNIALASLNGMNEAMTTQEDFVTVKYEGTDPITGDVSTYQYNIPSYAYTLDQLSKISNTVNTFVAGEGVVLLNDGTYREVKTIPVAKSPNPIVDVIPPSKFNIKNNWFFESLLFPQIYVQFDLKGKIDDRSDRVVVRRILFDNFDETETQWFKTNFIGQELSFEEVTQILTEAGKRYWIDEEVQNLPLNPTKYTGSFLIINKQTLENKEWYYLNTLNYGLTTDTSVIKNIELKMGDQLRYNDSLYQISSIEVTEKRVNLIAMVGLGKPTINNRFYIYSTPFFEKIVQIPIGYDECDIIFIKGVNDDYNIIADDWGTSISFYSNDLTLVNSTTTLETYYLGNVVDFGKQMEGQAKEKQVPAYYGINPDSPSISADQFTVKQINTQLNAALDTEAIKSTQTQIESTKTIINSLKTTIAQQKAELVELTDAAQRDDLQTKINNNISDLSKKTVEYQSLVKSLATIAYENKAVLADPKYRVRGFFEIPQGKTLTANPTEKPQEIIQFDIAYRYLRLDNTGNPLNTYSYADPLTDQLITGTFTDWNIVSSSIKKKIYDTSAGIYVWIDENIASGEEVNINQVDIPITKGEKVQLKIRSISEAGWPYNPLKSDWSNTVIIDFPSNLEGSDQVVNILEDSRAEETSIQLQETLEATGVITHLQDGSPNPNESEGTYFKHQSEFIGYNFAKKDLNNNVISESTIDLQSVLSNMTNKSYITLTKPTGASDPEPSKTVTLQQVLQAIIDASAAIYDAL